MPDNLGGCSGQSSHAGESLWRSCLGLDSPVKRILGGKDMAVTCLLYRAGDAWQVSPCHGLTIQIDVNSVETWASWLRALISESQGAPYSP